ncbi:MAG: hypothetical protein AB1458_16845 [Bacteroidota bacterium]
MSNETYEPTAEVKNESKCTDCGAVLKFAPGTTHLKCEYCGAQNNIVSESAAETVVEEIDFERFLSEANLGAEQKEQIHTVKCNSCGASSTLKPNVTADNCPFCDTPLVLKNESTSTIVKPKYLLPFAFDNKKALEAFRKWVAGLWFAPNDLKLYANNPDRLNGMYMPYWTYDSDTYSNYTGMRGVNRTESYTTTVNGKTQTRTRTVTDWYPCSGSVSNDFDDVLVLASKSLPEKYANALEPWDLSNLSDYNTKFLSGFRSEMYQVDLKEGFEKAKARMDVTIRKTVCQDIGGNHQRILTLNTRYDNITFKHILLPVWISAFRYNDKTYRFMINGRTGEVQGERPWSWIKITLTVLGVLGAAAAAYFIWQSQQ